MSEVHIRWVYLVVDVSGSTTRSGLNDAINLAMPHVVDGLTAQPGREIQLAVLAAGLSLRPVLGLTPVSRIELIPPIQPERLGLLATALNELATTMTADSARSGLDDPSSDPASTRVSVVLVSDGVPVDRAESLRAAFQRVRDVPPTVSVTTTCVVVGEVVGTGLAALSDRIVAASVEAAELGAIVVQAAVQAF